MTNFAVELGRPNGFVGLEPCGGGRGWQRKGIEK